MAGNLSRLTLAAVLLAPAPAAARGVDVSGRIEMPAICSPEVIPAVVRLDPVGASTTLAIAGANPPHFIDQRGLRFDPRVVAMRVGEVLRFGNADPELHNVHIQGSGTLFNQGVAPAGSVEFVASKAGIFRVVCDIHSHMRAYVVVGDSPWVACSGRSGAYRFRDVPDGRYRLRIWHEMGTPLERDVLVEGKDLDLGTLNLEEGSNPVTASDRELVCVKGCEPWPQVLDRISVTLAASLEAAQRPASAGRAVPLVQDAFYRDFEASGMGTAIRVHLGRNRAVRIEDLFREITETTQGVITGEASSPSVLVPTRQALMTLSGASEELNRVGVTERSNIFAATSPAFWVDARSASSAPRHGLAAVLGYAPRGLLAAGLCAVVLLSLLTAAAAHVRARGEQRVRARRACVLLATVAVAGLSVVLAFDCQPSETPRQPAPKADPASPVPVPTAAPVREHPIGLDVTRNHLRIAALWHHALRTAKNPAPAPGAVHLLARVHATEGNPNGFAKGDWVPYLSIRYTVTPARGGPVVAGMLRPLLASDGPRYGANLPLAAAGEYRITLHIEPPSDEALSRFVDPADGVAPWWEPFDVEFAWPYRPEPR